MYRFTYQILLRLLTFYYMITTISLVRINRRNFTFQNLSFDFEEIFRSNLHVHDCLVRDRTSEFEL